MLHQLVLASLAVPARTEVRLWHIVGLKVHRADWGTYLVE